MASWIGLEILIPKHPWKSKIGLLQPILAAKLYVTFFLGHPVHINASKALNLSRSWIDSIYDWFPQILTKASTNLFSTFEFQRRGQKPVSVLPPLKVIPRCGCLSHRDQQTEVSERPWPKKEMGAVRLKTTTATEARFGWTGLRNICVWRWIMILNTGWASEGIFRS